MGFQEETGIEKYFFFLEKTSRREKFQEEKLDVVLSAWEIKEKDFGKRFGGSARGESNEMR